jgi:hypothetical protein
VVIGRRVAHQDPDRMHAWTRSLLFWLRGHGFVDWDKGSPLQAFFK